LTVILNCEMSNISS